MAAWMASASSTWEPLQSFHTPRANRREHDRRAQSAAPAYRRQSVAARIADAIRCVGIVRQCLGWLIGIAFLVSAFAFLTMFGEEQGRGPVAGSRVRYRIAARVFAALWHIPQCSGAYI